ncbi:hypothetical protein KBK19_10285 [Microvirga sp. STR05]|uniref:DUF2946 domain-containing protein n=1 Tax=Hymenobacter duratus TaxID=2771356 RepID=A0ABR8JI70_9BACT|nr:hypothetical protein [Hymenobacter duratus]MBD2715423.1 hypothetical protein [Hymenobacter duratus]MBR7950331.1 hypothetical protein [Microvirga sp. STR05]
MVSPRPVSHRLFSLLLALLVLASSVGLTVLRHTCRESGHTSADVIFSTPKHGCPTPKPAAEHAHSSQIKGACCDFSAHLHKLEVPAPELTWAKLLPPPLLAPVWLPATSWPTLPPAPLVAQAAAWHAADSSPPPRAGRVLLTFISVLVV